MSWFGCKWLHDVLWKRQKINMCVCVCVRRGNIRAHFTTLTIALFPGPDFKWHGNWVLETPHKTDRAGRREEGGEDLLVDFPLHQTRSGATREVSSLMERALVWKRNERLRNQRVSFSRGELIPPLFRTWRPTPRTEKEPKQKHSKKKTTRGTNTNFFWSSSRFQI